MQLKKCIERKNNYSSEIRATMNISLPFFILLLFIVLLVKASFVFNPNDIFQAETDSHSVSESTYKGYKYNDKLNAFYKLHLDEKHWQDADTQCMAEGTRWLATPESDEEYEYILKLLEENSADSFDIGLRFHKGREASSFEGKYTTLLDDLLDCIKVKKDGSLQRTSCQMIGPYVCKHSFCETSDTDYFAVRELRRCYKLHVEPRRWSVANGTCRDEGAYLAIINSEAEAKELVAGVRKVKHPIPYLSDDSILLGFHDQFEDNSFVTVHGDPLADSGYNKWVAGEPNNWHGQEDCGAMRRNGELNDVSCSKDFIFYCEREITV